jgi:hypothetical protein
VILNKKDVPLCPPLMENASDPTAHLLLGDTAYNISL